MQDMIGINYILFLLLYSFIYIAYVTYGVAGNVNLIVGGFVGLATQCDWIRRVIILSINSLYVSILSDLSLVQYYVAETLLECCAPTCSAYDR